MDAEGCSRAACSYFFTVRLEDDRCESLIEHIDALCLAFRACRDRYPFAMTAGVILPDHLHCVLSLPSADAPRDPAWRLIKGLFESAVDCGPDLWRPDFDERRIEDDAELSRHIDDIHADPVRHGLVGSPSEWPYSSFHAYVAHGLRPAHWRAGDFAGPRPPRAVAATSCVEVRSPSRSTRSPRQADS